MILRPALCLLACLTAVAAAAADDAVVGSLQKSLQRVLPDAKVTEVAPSGLPGIYRVMLGAELIYMSEDGRYVMRGDLIDLDERKNLTEIHRSSARAAALRQIKNGSYIEFAPDGPVRHVVWVFTDVDCGYCRKFHTEVPAINKAGIAVRYLAFPRGGIGSQDYRNAVGVWCAADRKQALTEAKLGRPVPEGSCDNPVKADYELGQSLGIQGTPTIYLESGREVGGYVPAATLVEMLGSDRS